MVLKCCIRIAYLQGEASGFEILHSAYLQGKAPPAFKHKFYRNFLCNFVVVYVAAVLCESCSLSLDGYY